MKQQLTQAVDNLENFLLNIESIDKHPYSKGVDVTKLIKDLEDYAKDLKNMIVQLPDEAIPEVEVAETEEKNMKK